MHRTTPAPGCRCIDCYDGKPHQPVNERKLEAFLTKMGHPKSEVVKLRILTRGGDPDCEGTMTCTCSTCIKQRQVLDAARQRRASQPWEVRPARRAA